MPDREKVIECLQKAKMVIETWVPMFEQYNTPAGIDDAIALLKKQEPIVPKGPKTVYAYAFACGNCEAYVDRNWIACPRCGRRIKWE